MGLSPHGFVYRPLDQGSLAMTHGALGGLSYTLPTQSAPRVSLGYMPPSMGQERLRLLQLLTGPARHVHRHRQGVASRPLTLNADGADQSLFGGVAGSVCVAGPHPRSVAVQADKMRLLTPLASVHLFEHSLVLPAYGALFGVRAYSPIPVLYTDCDISKGSWQDGQSVSHDG